MYPCPICNSPNQYFSEERYEKCKICGWVDCVIQRDEPDNSNGVNPVSMNEAKKLWYLGESIYPEYPNKTRRVFVIDGFRFKNLKGFYGEMDNLFTSNLDYQTGHNLMAFSELIEGGFGVHECGEPIKIIWKNFAQSRINFGYGATVRYLESALTNCHPSNTDSINRDLVNAKNHLGKTLLDWIVNIMESIDNCVLEIIE